MKTRDVKTSLPPDRPESFYASGPAKMRALVAICGFVTFVLLFCSAVHASENITPASHARRYFKADVVIFGEVLGCTTNVVERKDVPGDSGWVNHYTTLASTCTVRVDSALKGALAESVIVIQKESSRAWKSRFEAIDENGDSLYMGQMAEEPGPGEANEIPSSGRWILFLIEKDSTYTFLWRAKYDRMNLDLYRKFAEEGRRYFSEIRPLRLVSR
ncbi:MAG: hypothetical protein WBD64_04510 [Candidatus Zixiibacteriota bacterium]